MGSRKRVLITGANRGLGMEICRYLSGRDVDLICTGRDRESLVESLDNAGVTPYHTLAVDLADKSSTVAFMEVIEEIELDHIVHVASPFGASFKQSSWLELGEWANFQFSAYLLAKHAIERIPANGRMIFVGSIAGDLNRISKEHSVYSVYKASLRMLAGAVRAEGTRSHYINLGTFRDDGGGGDRYLSTAQVAAAITDLLCSWVDEGLDVDLLPKAEGGN